MSQTKFAPRLLDPNAVPFVQGGNEAGRAIEGLGSDAANFLGRAVQAFDNRNLSKIEKESEAIGRDLENRVSPAFDIDGKAKEKLNRLGIAAGANALSETEVILRANQLAKELKFKYPGYEDVVDSEIDTRVFGGLRGKVLQAAFSEQSKAEQARAKATADRAEEFRRFRTAGALMLATEDTADFYEDGGVAYDFEASQRRMVALEAKDKNLDRAKNELAFSQSRFNYGKDVREDNLLINKRNYEAAEVDKILFGLIPAFHAAGITAGKDGYTPEEIATIQAQASFMKAEALKKHTQTTGLGIQEAQTSLAPVFTAIDNIQKILVGDDINLRTSAGELLKNNTDNAVYLAAESEEDVRVLLTLNSMGGDNPLFFEAMSSVLKDMNNGGSLYNAAVKANQRGVPVSETLAETSSKTYNKQDMMKNAAKAASTFLADPRLETSPEMKKVFVEQLSAVSADQRTLRSNPEAAKAFLKKFYGGGNAERTFKIVQELAGSNPSAAEQADQAVHLSKLSLVSALQSSTAAISSAGSKLSTSPELSKAFQYNPKDGTVTAKAKLNNTFVQRAQSLVTTQGSSPELVEAENTINTALKILKAAGETDYAENWLIQSGFIEDPAVKEDNKKGSKQ